MFQYCYQSIWYFFVSFPFVENGGFLQDVLRDTSRDTRKSFWNCWLINFTRRASPLDSSGNRLTNGMMDDHQTFNLTWWWVSRFWRFMLVLNPAVNENTPSKTMGKFGWRSGWARDYTNVTHQFNTWLQSISCHHEVWKDLQIYWCIQINTILVTCSQCSRVVHNFKWWTAHWNETCLHFGSGSFHWSSLAFWNQLHLSWQHGRFHPRQGGMMSSVGPGPRKTCLVDLCFRHDILPGPTLCFAMIVAQPKIDNPSYAGFHVMASRVVFSWFKWIRNFHRHDRLQKAI